MGGAPKIPKGTRQIRAYVPIEVCDRLDRSATALNMANSELTAQCIELGIDDAIRQAIARAESTISALKEEVGEEAGNGNGTSGGDWNHEDPPPPRKGRAEAAAAREAKRKQILEEQEAEERRRRRRGGGKG